MWQPASTQRPRMVYSSWIFKFIFVLGVFIAYPVPTHGWDADTELFDLVEEMPKSFYEFLNVEQDASSVDIRKAYRRLSLLLHPDKNKDENAETQFRQLVGIYEVLKDDERRKRYDDILVNGLPDWRQAEFYSWRVRKMSNGELGFLLFVILTVVHYAVIWSIYFEKQLDELLRKKKKEKKKKLSSKTVEELKSVGGDKVERPYEKPHWQDILPLKLGIWLYFSLKSLPDTIQEVKQYYKDTQEMKIKEKEAAEQEAMEEQEALQREKRPKVKKPKIEFPVYEPPVASNFCGPVYDQGTSIEDIECQMDDWLEDKKSQKKTLEWTEEDLSQLTRNMAKFPGGTPGRWEKIAHELGRSVTDVTTKVKRLKDCVNHTSGLVKLSDLRGKASKPPAAAVPDCLMTQREEPEADSSSLGPGADTEGKALRRRVKKTGGGADEKVKGRRQRDFDPTAVEEDSEEEGRKLVAKEKRGCAAAEDLWTQNQQKLLELALQQHPRGTTERWEKIALLVPGKSKEECTVRYKMLAELVQKKKQAKS